MLVFASLLKLDVFSFLFPGTGRIPLPVLGHLSVDITVGKTPSMTDSVREVDLPQALFGMLLLFATMRHWVALLHPLMREHYL